MSAATSLWCWRCILMVAIPLAAVMMLSRSGVSGEPSSAVTFSIQKTDHGVEILGNGELWAAYVADGEFKPYVWPIIGPTGKPFTREWPMGPGEGEKHDHPHQRSLWFTHGDVNGISFWEEAPGRGKIVHREFLTLEGGTKGIVVTRNDWVAPDGTVLLNDVRKLLFYPLGENRVIDFAIRLSAVAPSVTFGDTKEGTFGLRVADSMTVDAKKGGKIVNSEGQEDKDAWGKKAKWVDYSGPVDGEIVGIAVLNHPSSFRFPTYWHVRTYGLFAANPFGWHDFVGRSDVSGAYTLGKGQSIELRYRVILHKGRTAEAKIPQLYEEYAAEPPLPLP
ncbi:MAG: PmoA family protein [Thermogutta sp.]|uniref:DUF6807 domain-containing protein n=1 Tax=Thermogutta sp. TaxID=1962930 RepID=UPI0019A34DD9|nr:PmoA family protein [Thermogutta sp.]MBC7352003.1 PmoA family protein [Thermogutta sp.]